MIKAYWIKKRLFFKKEVKTSRGSMHCRDIWLLFLEDSAKNRTSVGECAPLSGLSIDDMENFERTLDDVSLLINRDEQIHDTKSKLIKYPSILFGLEMALIGLSSEKKNLLFPSEFTEGNQDIKINGLIWMSSYEEMRKEMVEKLRANFRCIKIKIGSIEFEKEYSLIKELRKLDDKVEIRLDANGAFSFEEALEKIKFLARFNIHSIEQPIKPKIFDLMSKLCQESKIPIALDEELIGIIEPKEQNELLDYIKPSYIVLKPTLLGGFEMANNWILQANKKGIKWWITSALESNIALSAIAQWTYSLGNERKRSTQSGRAPGRTQIIFAKSEYTGDSESNLMVHGLGTGELYKNNFISPLYLKDGSLRYNPFDERDAQPNLSNIET